MNLDGTTIDEYRLEGLDAESVQGRSPVKQYWSLFDYLLQYVIYLWLGSLHQPSGTLDVGGKALHNQSVHHKWLK